MRRRRRRIKGRDGMFHTSLMVDRIPILEGGRTVEWKHENLKGEERESESKMYSTR